MGPKIDHKIIPKFNQKPNVQKTRKMTPRGPKIGQNQCGLAFCKRKTPYARPFLGRQKGPSARFLVGNPGRLGSRPGGIFGPALCREYEKRRFWKQQKHATFFGRLGTPGLGDPLGRPFSHYRHTTAFPGTRLGADLGSRRGRKSMANPKSDDF